MRVAVVGTAGVGSLASSFAAGAESAGHVASVIDVPQLAAGSRALFLSRRISMDGLVARPAVHRLEKSLHTFRPEIVVAVKGRFLRSDAVARLRRELSVPFLNYYPDHPLWPGHDDPQILEALEAYDEVIVWGTELRDALASQGLRKVRRVLFGYDPAVYRPPSQPMSPRWDVAVVGQCYERRLRFAEALAEFDVLASGAGWRKAVTGGPLDGRAHDRSYPGDLTCALYSQSRIALNILADWNIPAHNMRTFEVPASRTAMVATRTPDHEALFGEEGAVLVTTPEEAREATRTLLADEELRERVARIGRERVEPHTYAARMQEILAPWSPARRA